MALSKNVRCPSPNSCNGLIERHRISMTGASEYKLNKRTVTYTTYNEALIKHNILVKAKNVLVFQGDVEAAAASLVHHSSSPKDAHSPSTPVSTSPPPPAYPHSKKCSKLTPEQRAKLETHERERALESRVRMLTEKLFECLRPFVEAKNPGGAGDEETAAWETRMHREADDLKFESFGVELLHALGTVCNTKATSFFKQSWILVKVEGEGRGRERRVGRDW